MSQKFSGQLNLYLRQAGLPLRSVASQTGIPHQTIHNWCKGSQPRWYSALPGDLRRLGTVLGLNAEEIAQLLMLAGGVPARTGLFAGQEVPMQDSLRIPKGWFDTGDGQGTYHMGVDPGVTCAGRPCVTILAGTEAVEFGALAQEIKAAAYQGKRLRFSAALCSAGLVNRAALFMRVTAANGKMLAFDNMRERFISGSNDWTQHAIVLEVAEDAEAIIFGLLSSQQGQVWMADVHLDVVDRSVPTTDILAEIAPYFPVNLDFAE
jgi:hypothetical protein